MPKIKTSARRFFYNLKNRFFTVENTVLFIAIILCLGWTYGAISSMTRNWQLSRVLVEKQYEEKILELEIESLGLENAYYSSEEYQELSARKKLNKKLPGETLIYLAENSEEAKKKHEIPEKLTGPEKNNLSEWTAFLLGI
ncbi:hypothetical protein IKG45_03165 [Candidatus Saccharibacteria bacterium]|nr:hypothetical protein [Candidatus Saccharibacteria bacterium]